MSGAVLCYAAMSELSINIHQKRNEINDVRLFPLIVIIFVSYQMLIEYSESGHQESVLNTNVFPFCGAGKRWRKYK